MAVLKCHKNRINKNKHLKERVKNLSIAMKTYERIQILKI
jgi:hypothetical protein